MAIFEWRKFNLFDLRKDADDGKVGEALKEATITSATNGNNQIVICDSFGFIHVFSRNWDVISFKGHDGNIPLCELARQHNLLITIGNEDNGTVPVFKIWNLTKATKGGTLPCLRTVKTILQKPTTLAVAENGQYMAIGFDRGSISLYRGDISRDRSKSLQTLSCGIAPITGIAFKISYKSVHMFVCSDSVVVVYILHSKDKESKIVLDNTGEPTRCCALQTTQQASTDAHFMVGKDDAVYCYTVDGRGPCYALDGKKTIIQWFRSHLLTISKPSKNTISSQKDSIFTVIDVLNKFIVFSSPIDAIATILIEFGTCYLITVNKEVFHLDEKDLQSKLSLLFKKNLYDIAVRIAKNNQYDSEGLAEIFKQYGDHLYSKGDFAGIFHSFLFGKVDNLGGFGVDLIMCQRQIMNFLIVGAVEQYAKTIGFLEPSYIIRRFLDSRHIHYLTDYLQSLHKQGHATADHTTLLLNCFTRLDRTDQLKEFLRNDQNPDIMFDLDVAIKVCRTASVEHALALAKRNQKHDFCLSILTEDQNAFVEAINYIAHLPFVDAEENLRKYGLVLMDRCPSETTELLKLICTNYRQAQEVADTQFLDANSVVDRANPEDFIQLFVKSPDRLIDFLEHLVANLSKLSPLVYNTLIEMYLHQWEMDQRGEQRLMDILKNYDQSYDRNHALVMCRTSGFWPGVLHIYEEQKLYHLIVRHHLKKSDYNELLHSCKRLGSAQPSLWLQALTGLRNDKKAPPNLLSQILQVIAHEKLQSPLQILNCLAVENGPNLASVREYFLQVFHKENECAKQEEDLVTKYRSDSMALKKHIHNLQDNAIEFRGTLCNTCHQPLSMPALYFLCQHSYHHDCVRGYSENDKDCPVCHTKNLQLKDALHAQSESRDQHEVFHNLLDRSSESFSVVAEYFGRGLFNKIVIVEEADLNDDINKNVPDVSHLAMERQLLQQHANPGAFGAGAEAKIRAEEGHSAKEVGIKVIPVPEGRMRMQETNKFSTSLEANISRISMARNKNPRSSPKNNKGKGTFVASKSGANPFGDEPVYDKAKDPFADDADDEMDESLTGAPTTTNPFGEYDDNLNPFA